MPAGQHHQRGRQGRGREEGARGRRGLRGGLTRARRVPYHFAHTTLPILSFGDPLGFYRTLDSREGEEHLRGLWRELSSRMGEPVTSSPRLARFDAPGYRLFVVTLPGPERSTEAWMVCLAYAVRRTILGLKVGERRFFTLERGEDPATHATVRWFCEWEGARERHRNHGAVEAAGLDGFVALVRARLEPPPAEQPA